LHSLHNQSLGELEVKNKTSNLKWEGKSGNQDNVLEAGARSDRLEQDLEGKLPPFSSFSLVIFLCGVLVAKKAMVTCCHRLLLYVWEEEDNGNALSSLPLVLL
jgi:hypothetical protein